jgi:hypothetical protein
MCYKLTLSLPVVNENHETRKEIHDHQKEEELAYKATSTKIILRRRQ